MLEIPGRASLTRSESRLRKTRDSSYSILSQKAKPPRPGSTEQPSTRFWTAGTALDLLRIRTPPAWPIALTVDHGRRPRWAGRKLDGAKHPLARGPLCSRSCLNAKPMGRLHVEVESESAAASFSAPGGRSSQVKRAIAQTSQVLQPSSWDSVPYQNVRRARTVCGTALSGFPTTSEGSEKRKSGCCFPAVKRFLLDGEEG
jgi:hypothetical protein